MKIYEAAHVEEAVDLAYKLKADGHYNWFRGQVQDWPPVSSLYRLQTGGDSEKELMWKRRMVRFMEWADEIPELQYVKEPEHGDALVAIMQHYGIATSFVDFTTDPGVAGFFAAHTEHPPTWGRSCIYCLNTDDFLSDWNIISQLDSREGASIELVTIDVSNLWRLQAQHGVFLFHNYDWSMDLPMDRILFPYSGYPSFPTHDSVYPKDKSPLEQLLDRYFFLESATFANEELQQWIAGLQREGQPAEYVQVEAWPEGYCADAFVDSARIGPLESWNPETVQAWDVAQEEDYYETVGSTVTLRLNPQASAEEIAKSVSFGVQQALRSDSAIRSRAVEWVLTGLPESLSADELRDTVRPVWNGMRRLPYTDGEIGVAVGTVVALLIARLEAEAAWDSELEMFSRYFGDCVRVGFSTYDRSGSYGIVTRDSLRAAIRKDIAELLAPEYKAFADDVYKLFRIIYNPRLMFDFDAFKAMFAREAIPAQAVMRRQLMLFNPAHLFIFGMP